MTAKGEPVSDPSSRFTVVYWVVVGILFAFGVAAIFSIGAPFLLVAFALAGLGPFRGQPKIFWPPTAAIVGGIAGFFLMAPFSCSASATLTGEGSTTLGTTTCRSLVGISYSRTGTTNPSFIPALIVAFLAAIAAAFAARFLIARLEPKGDGQDGSNAS